MRLLCLDIATSTGWVTGEVIDGKLVAPLQYKIERLKQPSDPVEVVGGKMGRLLRDACYWEPGRPDFIGYEEPIPPYQNNNPKDGRQRNIVRSAASITLPQQAIGAVHAMAAVYGIGCDGAHAATIRKTFIGRANFGSPEETSEAVIKMAIAYGYLPEGFRQHDVADGVACFHHFAVTKAGLRPDRLVMFPQRAVA